jgi:AraC-like DNA-binding protein
VIEALVEATGASAKSLFHLFRRTRAMTPMTYVHRVHLRHARALLTSPMADTSVGTE